MTNLEFTLRKINNKILMGERLKDRQQNKVDEINKQIYSDTDQSTILTNELFELNNKAEKINKVLENNHQQNIISKLITTLLIVLAAIISASHILLFFSFVGATLFSVNKINKKILSMQMHKKVSSTNDIRLELTATKQQIEIKMEQLKATLKIINENKLNRVEIRNKIDAISDIIDDLNFQFDMLSETKSQEIDFEKVFTKDIQKVLKLDKKVL